MFFWSLPDALKAWTTLYYGPRGSVKTLHQGKETIHIFSYLEDFYAKNPTIHPAIVVTNQKFSPRIEHIYLGSYLYYWEGLADLHYCPRKKCWRGPDKHPLHGAFLVIDDVATILPADGWTNTPIWFRKMLAQARHNGVRVLANIQDPFSCDINFRRYVDVAFKFSKVFGNRDPDETRRPVKFIFGIYRRRRIAAEMLWKYGDLPEQQIRLNMIAKEEQDKRLKEMDRAADIVQDDSWRGSYHYFTRKHAEIYDTTQNVKESEPLGYTHKEFKCLDPGCKYKHVKHELT